MGGGNHINAIAVLLVGVGGQLPSGFGGQGASGDYPRFFNRFGAGVVGGCACSGGTIHGFWPELDSNRDLERECALS